MFVGERALAVVVGSDSRGDDGGVYTSQWGGTDSRLRRVLGNDGDPFVPLLETNWQYRGAASLATLFRTLDYLAFEVVYVLSPFGVTAYYPLWFGLPCCGPVAPTDGLLVALDGAQHRSRLRRFLRQYKSLLLDGIDWEILSPERARACLAVVGRHCAQTAVTRE